VRPAAAAAALLLLCACRGPSTPPEVQLREMLDRAETAAETRDLGALRKLIAADYTDVYGHDRRAIDALLRFYVAQHHSIYVLKFVREVELPEPGRARAVILAGISGQPIADASQLEPARADLLRFTLDLRDEGGGKWTVARAQWERASLNDFL